MTCTLTTTELSATATEYVLNEVTTNEPDPTIYPVEYAFPTTGVAPSTWVTGSWEPGTPYTSRCLVGPAGGAVTLSAGVYDVWVRITASPETPIRNTGELAVY